MPKVRSRVGLGKCIVQLGFVGLVFAAQPGLAAGWFSGKDQDNKSIKQPESQLMSGPMSGPSQGQEKGYKKPSAEDRAKAMRAEPLVRAAFFSNVFEHDPKDFKAGLIVSESLRALGRYQEAAVAAQRILVLNPDHTQALFAASKAYILDNNAFYALNHLQRLTELNPKDWHAYSLLGVAYDQIKRYDEAQAAWNKALLLSPDNLVVMTNIAMAKATRGDFAAAETLMRQVVAKPDATIQMRQNLALLLGLQDKMPEAEKLLRQDLPPEAVEQNLAWFKDRSQPKPAAAVADNRNWSSLKDGS
jgi:Flp pilus assembly protein TadD